MEIDMMEEYYVYRTTQEDCDEYYYSILEAVDIEDAKYHLAFNDGEVLMIPHKMTWEAYNKALGREEELFNSLAEEGRTAWYLNRC